MSGLVTVCNNRKKGYSLIEAAIVLGIVGGVIGGVWWASASVITMSRINSLVEGTLQAVRTARELFPIPTLYAMSTAGSACITPTVCRAGGLPPEKVKMGSNCNSCIQSHIHGGRLIMYAHKDNEDVAIILGAPFRVEDCIGVVVGVANAGKKYGLKRVQVDGTPWRYWNAPDLPTSPHDADLVDACNDMPNEGGDDYIRFTFSALSR